MVVLSSAVYVYPMPHDGTIDNIQNSGAKTRHQAMQALMALKDLVHKLVQHQAILELHQPTSLNMAACLTNRDHTPQAQWLTNPRQLILVVSKVAMEVRPRNPRPLRIQLPKWVMEVLPALVAMVEVGNQIQMLNGVLQLRKASAVASAATRAKFWPASCGRSFYCAVSNLLWFTWDGGRLRDIKFGG